jgi:hypothetical protein
MIPPKDSFRMVPNRELRNCTPGVWKIQVFSRPPGERRKQRRVLISAAAVGARIAAIELFNVKLGRAERATGAGLCSFRTKIAFVRRVSTPFAEAAPKVAQITASIFRGDLH